MGLGLGLGLATHTFGVSARFAPFAFPSREGRATGGSGRRGLASSAAAARRPFLSFGRREEIDASPPRVGALCRRSARGHTRTRFGGARGRFSHRPLARRRNEPPRPPVAGCTPRSRAFLQPRDARRRRFRRRFVRGRTTYSRDDERGRSPARLRDTLLTGRRAARRPARVESTAPRCHGAPRLRARGFDSLRGRFGDAEPRRALRPASGGGERSEGSLYRNLL